MKTSLIESAELYVINYLKNNLPTGFLYHSVNHTQEVLEAVNTLVKQEKIQEEDKELLRIAAWFHDIGYAVDIQNHEEHSVTLVVDFLKDLEISLDKVETIVGCIRATKIPQNPQNKLEQIMCDADLSHIATTKYEDYSKLLRAEWDLTQDKSMSDIEWYQCTLDFFKEHRFFTDFAYKNWENMKAINMMTIQKKLKSALQKVEDEKLKNKTKKVEPKKENKRAEKGIETMYRVTLRNHIKLSDIADTKANILLSVNAIILSIALSTLLPKLDKPDNQYLIIPTLFFVLTAVISMIFAIISTKPKVTSGIFTKEDIDNKKVNLLFFGNFHKMPLSVFDEGIFKLIEDKEYLYKSLNKDLYFLGVVLARKYKLLRITYTIFMIGIILSVLSFGYAFYDMLYFIN